MKTLMIGMEEKKIHGSVFSIYQIAPDFLRIQRIFKESFMQKASFVSGFMLGLQTNRSRLFYNSRYIMLHFSTRSV